MSTLRVPIVASATFVSYLTAYHGRVGLLLTGCHHPWPPSNVFQQRQCPVERFALSSFLGPVCRWYGGAVVKRTEVQDALQMAAEAKSFPAARFKSHSLRIGGASAIYHATGDTEVVKRHGRWSSSAFHRHLWESDEHHQQLAAKMADTTATVHYT